MELTNAIGRRKTSVARIYLTSGQGTITVNKKPLEVYFSTSNISRLVKQPLDQVAATKQYDIRINVTGGGFKGQAEAIKLGIARALCKVEPIHRTELKKQGFLARDPRIVERKKYGRRKARRRFQFSKR